MKRRRGLTMMVGVLVLSIGLVLANYGGGVTPAVAAPPAKEDPHAGVTQNWDSNLPSASRFTVLTDFGGAAVRDNNTGLVWEQAADATPRTWLGATSSCVNKEVPAVGGTRGWRLPSVVELASVQDPSLPAPFVPASVFSGVQSAGYWSAATLADNPTFAWFVNFGNGLVSDLSKTDAIRAWCVRGGMHADQY